jgi:hypothetical protein
VCACVEAANSGSGGVRHTHKRNISNGVCCCETFNPCYFDMFLVDLLFLSRAHEDGRNVEVVEPSTNHRKDNPYK